MSMWKRQEVQKVLRRSSLGLLLVALLLAKRRRQPSCRNRFGAYKTVAKGRGRHCRPPVWDEYGFQTAERAELSRQRAHRVSVSVWQLKDTTGALAAAQWLQPGVVQHGNYVIRDESRINLLADWSAVTEIETSQSGSGSESEPPAVPAGEGSREGSRSGTSWVPLRCAKFEPEYLADLAGFNKGAEAQLARYKTQHGEVPLLLLSYPTPQIAGDRFRAFEKRTDLKARRMVRWSR